MTTRISPEGFTRHVAWLAGADYLRSRRKVPYAKIGPRSVCYFGNSNYWALFEYGSRVGKAYSPVVDAARPRRPGPRAAQRLTRQMRNAFRSISVSFSLNT